MLEPEFPKLLTAEDVAQLLGKHPRTVLQMAVAGKIPAIRLGHRTVRFQPADVQAYIDAHRAAAL
jgi:excisionase family DNA binding protein